MKGELKRTTGLLQTLLMENEKHMKTKENARKKKEVEREAVFSQLAFANILIPRPGADSEDEADEKMPDDQLDIFLNNFFYVIPNLDDISTAIFEHDDPSDEIMEPVGVPENNFEPVGLTPLRTHKFYSAIFCWLLDISCVNAFPLFKEDHPEEASSLKQFKISLADELLLLKRRPKRGRPSSSSSSSPVVKRVKYRYAAPKDILLMVMGSVAAMINGVALPATSFLFGDLTAAFVSQANHSKNPTDPSGSGVGSLNNSLPASDPDFLNITNTFGLYYIYIGLFVCVLTFIQNACWELACCNQIFKLRQVFFAQAMRQDVAWFDERENEDLTNKITDDMERMRDGLGSKVPVLFHSVTLLFAGLSVGFYTNWRLTLVIMVGGPLLLVSTAWTAFIASGVAAREQLRYGIAGGIASQVLTSLRTVSAFGGEKKEIQRFADAVISGKKLTMKKYYYLSGGMAISMAMIYLLYGIGLWYGGQLFLQNMIQPGQIFTVFMSVITGALGIGNSLPNVIEISTAIGAASTVFEIVDHVPKIDPYSREGQTLPSLRGEIEFKNVYFPYPMRPQVMVLSGLNLKIQPGKVVAVVGASGAGKSTLVSLILRFYDPLCGKVLVDGTDIAEMNIQSFRSQVGVVSQEPVLFDVSIEENIRYGKPDAGRPEIEEAARIAFAHTFIESLPQGYDTLVGERGVQLSGGQKQRIAIARAILRRPKVLLLDEATSALDAHSETVVQAALENAARGRTTLIIAHRLSTVKNADVIYAMKDGQLAESGTHEELMAKKSIYYNLVLAQTKKTANDEEETLKVSEPVVIPKEPIKRMLSFKKITLRRMSSKTVPEEKKKEKEVSYFRLLKVSDSPWALVYACIACAVTGLHMPAFAFLYGGILGLFALPLEEFQSAVNLWSILFFVLAFFTGLAMSSAVLTSSKVTEDMIKDLRIKTFKNILSQQLSFFDHDSNSPIKLTNTLAKEPPQVKNIAGFRAGFIIITTVTTSLSLGIAFYCGWQIALIVLCFVPVIVFGNWIQMRMRFKSMMQEVETTAVVAKIASECLQNIKTVQFLCLQEYMLSKFIKELQKSLKDEKKQGYVFAISFALVSATIFLMYGCTFKFGSVFVASGYMNGNDIFRTVFALVFAATQLGSTVIFFQDFGKAKVAISKVYTLMKTPTKLDVFSTQGETPIIDGTVEFRDVYFSYPTRPHIEVLQGLSLRIPQGRTVALVGGSGCGKSTLISLLQRFYNSKRGEILIDGVNIESMNVRYLRSQMGLVTQEPTLFDSTLRENITYGMENLGREVTSQEIIEAAKAANIHDFIVSLPQGYETRAGDRGSKLSGGQKQRVAIARALLRNPKILLLDEATSALDTESEKVVQDALDRARAGRTSIVIAHRLSTVKNADLIAVIADGRVVELGTHSQLLELKGHYYDLVKDQ